MNLAGAFVTACNARSAAGDGLALPVGHKGRVWNDSFRGATTLGEEVLQLARLDQIEKPCLRIAFRSNTF